MSTKEGIYYVGLMAGMGITAYVIGAYNIFTVGACCVVGLATGWLLQTAYEKYQAGTPLGPSNWSAKTHFGSGDVSCKNPYCNWAGEQPHSGNCPLCGTPLK